MNQPRTLLIANRGEIARRVIRTARRLGWTTVAIHTDLDATAMHVAEAHRALRVASYLDIDEVVAAARESGAGFVHPGYGFLSERARFSEACAEAGINFIGPTKQIIEMMGDKATARETMKKAGVPIIPGTGILSDIAEAVAAAKKVKYPVILKATAGVATCDADGRLVLLSTNEIADQEAC